jgi:DNA-binding NtrC family response regulator
MASKPYKPRIAMVDDNHLVVDNFARQFSDEFDILKITQPTKALDLIDDTVMVAVVDEKMDPISGTDLLARLRDCRPTVTRILLTAHADLDCLSKAINDADVKYFVDKRRAIAKDWDQYMRSKLRDAVDFCRDRRRDESQRQLQKLTGLQGFESLIGTSKALGSLLDDARKLAKTDISVLIRGETGTGKELLARAIHFESLRRAEVFVPLNCATFGLELAGSELFGHVKGAFTGAVSDKKGLLEVADTGTVFLDEIGDLRPDVQAHLNRFLDGNGEFRRIGEPTGVTRHSNVRIIAATHVDLDAAIIEKRFREDLYFRLKTCTLRLPPLRERSQDIPEIAAHLLSRACLKYHRGIPGLAQSALATLTRYHFPGNVRELKNLIESAVVLAPEDDAELELRYPELTSSLPRMGASHSASATLEEMETGFARERIRERLRSFGGNRQKTAESLGIDPRTLFNRMAALNIHWPET